MKKFILFFSILFVFCSLSGSALASPPTTEFVVSETTEFLSDGFSITITVIDNMTISTYASNFTKSGSKEYTLRNSSGDILWQFKLNAIFDVNSGVNATCKSTNYSINIVNSSWKNSAASSYASGNQGIGNATFVRKVLGITLESRDCQVILSCDKNGNLS